MQRYSKETQTREHCEFEGDSAKDSGNLIYPLNGIKIYNFNSVMSKIMLGHLQIVVQITNT